MFGMKRKLDQALAENTALREEVALLRDRLKREMTFSAELLDINYNLVWDNEELTRKVARLTMRAICPQFHRN